MIARQLDPQEQPLAVPESVNRDHLFISYDDEDEHLAEWLALRLTAEGYAVWCDRLKLLGGESYPRDIDAAIKERSFRVIALLSHSSLHKPNPLKERTLALNIARDRKVDFILPLNVDGLAASELGWMTSDLSYISFHRSWADGFARLLKKLDTIHAPRPLGDGPQLVRDWFALSSKPDAKPERLWIILFEIHSLPKAIFRVAVEDSMTTVTQAGWPHYRNRNDPWTFEPELPKGLNVKGVEEFYWRGANEVSGLWLPNVVTASIRKHLRARCPCQ